MSITEVKLAQVPSPSIRSGLPMPYDLMGDSGSSFANKLRLNHGHSRSPGWNEEEKDYYEDEDLSAAIK